MKMTFSTEGVDACGTSLKGHITVDKRLLEKFFGPSKGPSGDDKVLEEWDLEITDQNGDTGIVTIYDWKNYDLRKLPDDYSDWHVGGNSNMAPSVLSDLLIQLAKENGISNANQMCRYRVG